jgi:hypothetical protein
MTHEGVWYLVDKANGVVYANDMKNPEVVGSYSDAGGLELHNDEDFGEDVLEDGGEEGAFASVSVEVSGAANAPERQPGL